MPTPTYTALANITLGSSASSVTFSSIPATYRDLVLVCEGIPTNVSDMIRLRFNGDTGNNYNWVEAGGNGSATYSNTVANTAQVNFGYLVGTHRISMFGNIMDYSATDKHKTVLVRQSATGEAVAMRANRWANTAAITSLNVSTTTNSFSAGFTFALYGIAS